MSCPFIYIPEERVRQLLDWEKTYQAVECSLRSVAENRAFQNARSIINLPNSQNILFSMPGYLKDDQFGSLACKHVGHFPNDRFPAITANILYMDSETGQLKAIIAGTEITACRTAAASVVATKQLHSRKPGQENVLAILGAGAQGEIHARAFRHFFNFSQIKIWNRTFQRAKNLVDALNKEGKESFEASQTVEECVREADVIITATTGEETLVKSEWIKKGAHINAVAVGLKRELDDATYKASEVFVDYWEGAKNELKGLAEIGVELKGQVGDVIVGKIPPSGPNTTTIFQSLGMAVEDCAMARLIYDMHIKSSS